MSGTELIMGMEEVVQHIRELEKQLKEEKKKSIAMEMVAERIKEMDEKGRKHRSLEEIQEQNKKLQEENKNLKEREENLKEALALKFYKHYDEMDYDKLSLARTVGPDLGRMVDHLIEENKRIGGRCLEYEVDKLGELVDDEREKVKQLEEENKNLKGGIRALADEMKKMNEENKKLQAVISTEVARREKAEQSDKSARMTLSETIDELEKAKETAYHMGVDISTDNETSEDLLYYRFYTYTLDKSGDCDLTKEDVDEFTEDEAQRKILYDRIGYEEDSDSDEEEEDLVLYPTDTGVIQDPEHPQYNYSFGNNCKSKIGANSKMKRILKNGSIKDCVVANAYCMFVRGGRLYYVGRCGSGPAHVRTIKGEKTTIPIPDFLSLD